jgi:hypothetical protein
MEPRQPPAIWAQSFGNPRFTEGRLPTTTAITLDVTIQRQYHYASRRSGSEPHMDESTSLGCEEFRDRTRAFILLNSPI